jgi:hypothetical protein
LAGIFTVTAFTAPLHAQIAGEEPDALIEASLQVEAGVVLARNLAGKGDLYGAAATLERVLIAHPAAAEPRLLYASMLCRLDDRMGAEVELGLVDAAGVTETARREVTAACGTVALPASARGETGQ